MENENSLMTRVREALADDIKLKKFLNTIYIMVNDGTVILRGNVGEGSLKVLANKIVAAVPGVNRVINDMKIDAARHPRISVQIDWAKGAMILN